MDDDLEALRAELSAVDAELLALAARRMDLSLRIGRAKARLGRATRDFARERVVLQAARERADALSLDPGLAERITLALIETSLSVQEQDRLARASAGTGRRALVIGGAGRMGRWFASFLGAQGYEVRVTDPSGPVAELPWCADWRDLTLDDDLTVVATPLSATDAVLHDIAARPPHGVIFDIASLKTPLRGGLQALADAGWAVTSVHPMFGPDTSLLSGRHVLLVDVGAPHATAAAEALFAPTMASLATLDLDTHDRLMAVVLGLSHATNLAFNDALVASGAALPELRRLSSTTFDAQLGVAGRVARENPSLYFEIQALNQHGSPALEALTAAAARLRDAVADGDRARFEAIMLAGAAWHDARRDQGSGAANS
jgi:chorismate mutase/prephenate dehydrogenase